MHRIESTRVCSKKLKNFYLIHREQKNSRESKVFTRSLLGSLIKLIKVVDRNREQQPVAAAGSSHVSVHIRDLLVNCWIPLIYYIWIFWCVCCMCYTTSLYKKMNVIIRKPGRSIGHALCWLFALAK
jgi:hypothetical protein